MILHFINTLVDRVLKYFSEAQVCDLTSFFIEIKTYYTSIVGFLATEHVYEGFPDKRRKRR